MSMTSWLKPEITHKTKFTQQFSRIIFRMWIYGTCIKHDVDFGDMHSGDKTRTQVFLYGYKSMRTENGAK
jgi:hypothetical protein